MKAIGQEWTVWDSYVSFAELAGTVQTPPANQVRVYAKDKAGVSALYLKDDAGNEREIGLAPAANIVIGTGAVGRVAFWTTAAIIGSDANLFWDDTNKRLGLGITTPSVRLEILAASEAFVDIYRTSTDANAGGIRIAKSRSGGAVTTSDNIGVIGFGGHDGTAFRLNAATIQAFASSAWSGTSRECYIIFGTTPNGSVNRVERFRISSNGQWGIAGNNWGNLGDIFTSGGSAAPTWTAHPGAGINFGPAAVTSITVVNGHITAIL